MTTMFPVNFGRLTTHQTSQKALFGKADAVRVVNPVTFGSTAGTRFPNLGDSAALNHPDTVREERKAAKLYQLPDGVSAKRFWYYWGIYTEKPLPADKARDLNKRSGETVRAFGYAGGLEGKDFENWMKRNGNGVTSWHVDTVEGLAELSALLREHFAQ